MSFRLLTTVNNPLIYKKKKTIHIELKNLKKSLAYTLLIIATYAIHHAIMFKIQSLNICNKGSSIMNTQVSVRSSDVKRQIITLHRSVICVRDRQKVSFHKRRN